MRPKIEKINTFSIIMFFLSIIFALEDISADILTSNWIMGMLKSLLLVGLTQSAFFPIIRPSGLRRKDAELREALAKRAMEYLVNQLRRKKEGASPLGLGSGRAVDAFVKQYSQIFRGKQVVCASKRTEALAKERGLEVVDGNGIAKIDWYIDGADRVDATGNLIKGGGGAHKRDKGVRVKAKTFLCLVQESKIVPFFERHNFPLPCEITKDASTSEVLNDIDNVIGGEAQLRSVKRGNSFFSVSIPRETDSGNSIYDIHNFSFKGRSIEEISQQLNAIKGLVEHGFFVEGMKPSILMSQGAAGAIEVREVSSGEQSSLLGAH
jgi:ribose 5-phosphate isomerase A